MRNGCAQAQGEDARRSSVDLEGVQVSKTNPQLQPTHLIGRRPPAGINKEPWDRSGLNHYNCWGAVALHRRQYAWGHDELNAGSQNSREWFNMGLTIVDSLDTLQILKLHEEYAEARFWVANHLNFNQAEVSVSIPCRRGTWCSLCSVKDSLRGLNRYIEQGVCTKHSVGRILTALVKRM